jgi:hypothetical protein
VAEEEKEQYAKCIVSADDRIFIKEKKAESEEEFLEIRKWRVSGENIDSCGRNEEMEQLHDSWCISDTTEEC